MMRNEHVEWCKKRAREYLDQGDLVNAVASMTADMEKHPECGVNAFLMLMGATAAAEGDLEGVRRYIDGFR